MILPTNSPELLERAVSRAAELLQRGEVVALPTETVYGLAANALNPAAVARLFQVKQRPSHNPIIVHVASLDMARHCVRHWPAQATRLATAFWPGPLTLVLPRAAAIPDVVTAGGDTVGVRWPRHPVMEAVIRRCGFPLAAPSANLSGRISPTSASHVQKQLGARIPLIVDAGTPAVGIESTVLDLSTSPPRILRPGLIHAQSLEAVIGKLAGVEPPPLGRPLKSPGQLSRHYAPRARLVVWSWESDADLRQQVLSAGASPTHVQVLASSHIPGAAEYAGVRVLPREPQGYARALYRELHECDEQGTELIVVESVPDTPGWHGITDRLRRAAAHQ